VDTYSKYYYKYPDKIAVYPHGKSGDNDMMEYFHNTSSYMVNGLASTISPAALASSSLEEALQRTKELTAAFTRDTKKIKNSQMVAAAIFLAKEKKSKQEIKQYLEVQFGLDFSQPFMAFKKYSSLFDKYSHNVQNGINAFLEAQSFEDAIHRAADINKENSEAAVIAGSIAEAYYGLPKDMEEMIENTIDEDLKNIIRAFYARMSKNN